MHAILAICVACSITHDLSVDQKVLSLKGENEELNQKEFRKYGSFNTLEEVTLEGFTTLKSYALQGCAKLNIMNFKGSSLETIEFKTFENCASLRSIVIPNGVKTIHERIFEGCVSLTSIQFPSSLESISNSVCLLRYSIVQNIFPHQKIIPY